MKAGHAQDRDQHAVDEADDGAEHKADEDRRPDAEIVVIGIEDIGEDDADQAEGRADREIEILVGDDEGHADGHDGVARGIAQQRLEGVGRAEEFGIDEGADDIEERHHDQEADLPAAEELRRAPAERGHGSDVIGVRAFLGIAEASGRRVAREHSSLATSIRTSKTEDQFSKRLPTLPTVSFVTSWARVSRLAAAMPRSICR